MKKLILTFFSLCLLVNFSIAQDEGYVKMEITDVTSDNAEMATYLEMMKGTETEYYSNGEKSLVKANMMGGMVEMTTIVTNADESMVMYMNAMGKKMQIESTKSERDLAEVKAQKETPEFSVEYDENVTKEILGYKCIKAVVTFGSEDSDEKMTMEMFVAPELKMSAKMIQGLDKVDINGFPLEYTMDAGMMKVTATATELDNTAPDEVFDFNSKGYQKMTWQEFQDSMGAMSGGF